MPDDGAVVNGGGAVPDDGAVVNGGGAASGGGASRLVLPVPDLTGSTTVLRPWQADDALALAAAWRDPAVRARLAVPEPADEAAALRWIEQRGRAWSEGRSADLVVTDPASGAVIGEVGLSGFDPARRAARVGWWIGAGWRGRGRAGEAVRLVVDWVLGEGLLEAVMAEIGADNPASVAVARRAGLRPVARPSPATAKGAGPAPLLFARTRAQLPDDS